MCVPNPAAWMPCNTVVCTDSYRGTHVLHAYVTVPDTHRRTPEPVSTPLGKAGCVPTSEGLTASEEQSWVAQIFVYWNVPLLLSRYCISERRTDFQKLLLDQSEVWIKQKPASVGNCIWFRVYTAGKLYKITSYKRKSFNAEMQRKIICLNIYMFQCIYIYINLYRKAHCHKSENSICPTVAKRIQRKIINENI
jgi:hypothetical protein